MCRNIKVLFNFDPPATQEEIYASSLQFVRKISGFRKPSRQNQRYFDEAIDDISKIVTHLLDNLTTVSAPRNREAELAKARERTRQRKD